MPFPIVTGSIQREYERRYAAAPSGMPQICGCHGRACRQLNNTEGANRTNCVQCPLAAYAAGTRPRKQAEETAGSHVYMRLRLLSGRIEEIDVYLKPDGNHHYITSADHCPENHPKGLREEIIQAFHALY